MNNVCGHIISGQEVKDDGNKIEVYNPVNEKQITTIKEIAEKLSQNWSKANLR